MGFELPAVIVDIPTALREAETDAPAKLKPLLIQAAQEMELNARNAASAVAVLDEAMALRIGVMDSQSRADEVSSAMRRAMESAADKLRVAI